MPYSGGRSDTHSDAQHLLAIAKDAAAVASELVRSRRPITVTWKGDRDVTSDVDLTVEKAVRDFLRAHTPTAGFLGEEEGGHPGDGLHWVLDPIDGTVNFLHGVPLCAISLSLVYNGIVLAGVIDLPFLAAQYSAVRGQGSYANATRLQVSPTRRLDAALVSIDQYAFGEDAERKNDMRHQLTKHLAAHVQRVRVLGTSAIELVWTAQGRFDACIMLGNKPWDTSAGVLIAQEAGARVLDLDGSDHTALSSATIAVTPALEHDLMFIVRAALAETTLTD
ncbi:MAG: inositol monophosphatase [Actinomycetota bacterium]|nr:inositol monophosphatase [Actinomycetota bacterium]